MQSQASHDRILAGLRVLNTRDAEGLAALTGPLRKHGAEVVEVPLLKFHPPESWQPFDSRWTDLRPDDWVVFTSATAVRFFLERLAQTGQTVEPLAGARLAAIGPATAAAMESGGLRVELLPAAYQGEALLAALLERMEPGQRVWIPRAESARELLPEGLRRAGCDVAVTPAYRTATPEVDVGMLRDLLLEKRPHGKRLHGSGLDWIIFTSPSAVRHLFELLGAEAAGVIATAGWPGVACLGAVTARTAREKGLRVLVQPERQTLDGLIQALLQRVSVDHGGTAQVGDPTP